MPTKAVAKTPYELLIENKPSLKYFHVWRCSFEVGPCRPHEKKLESKTISTYFIGYVVRSKGYKFYRPTLKKIFQTELQHFLRMLSLRREMKRINNYTNSNLMRG